MAEDWNTCLQILDEQRMRSIVNMEPEVSRPERSFYVNDVIYVV